ncbi:hypothetical protein OIO90_005374 [Microbotryomycetes sp. JL221]|nr:hypothetical protein OIO90_005374 [Microbotryomycetes sp. JL221]
MLHTSGASAGDDVYRRCKRLRLDVFVTEQGYPERVETEQATIDDDSKCDHLLFTMTSSAGGTAAGDVDVGTLRIDSETFKLGRVAVIKQYRGTGLGQAMMSDLERFIKEHRGQLGQTIRSKQLKNVRLHCDSQTFAKKFYERCQWLIEGQEYMKPYPINSEYSILLCQTPEERERCWDVRRKVFVDEQGFSLELEIDDLEDDSDHLLLVQTSSNAPVGTIRYYAPKAKLGRLAVLPQFRTVGAGRMLVEAFERHIRTRQGKGGQWAKQQGIDKVVVQCSSQHQVEKFYAKLGYIREGEPYDDEGWPHVLLTKVIELDPL